MSSQRLVLGLPRVLPSLPPSPAPPCRPCVEGRLRATPHSSSLRPATEPFETLHLDVWGPAPRLGPERERYFLVVVDDFSRYTTVFPLAKKSEVTSYADQVVAHHRGHSWSSCQLSPLRPWGYAAHQLNLWPRVSRPEVSPTSLWTGFPGVASRFRVWGCLALVRDTSADKLSPRAVPSTPRVAISPAAPAAFTDAAPPPSLSRPRRLLSRGPAPAPSRPRRLLSRGPAPASTRPRPGFHAAPADGFVAAPPRPLRGSAACSHAAPPRLLRGPAALLSRGPAPASTRPRPGFHAAPADGSVAGPAQALTRPRRLPPVAARSPPDGPRRPFVTAPPAPPDGSCRPLLPAPATAPAGPAAAPTGTPTTHPPPPFPVARRGSFGGRSRGVAGVWPPLLLLLLHLPLQQPSRSPAAAEPPHRRAALHPSRPSSRAPCRRAAGPSDAGVSPSRPSSCVGGTLVGAVVVATLLLLPFLLLLLVVAARCSSPRPSRVSLTPRQLREWYAQSGGSLSAVRCSYVIRTGTRTVQVRLAALGASESASSGAGEAALSGTQRRSLPSPSFGHQDLPVYPVSRGASGLLLTPPSFPRQRPPLQTLHMDVWGPAPVRGQGHERYFLLVVDDYSPQEELRLGLSVLRLHSDRGGEFSSRLLRDYCRAQGIRQTFTLPDSPQQNGIAERRIGMVMDVARTSMMHAAAPHFLWPFAVRYAAHQLNLHPRVSRPAMSPVLLWTGKVGDASAFRVWGSRAFVRDLSADKLSPRAAPCVFLGFPPDAPGWQFYHPSSRRVLSSQDVTFDESVPSLPPLPLPYSFPSPPPDFLVPVSPPVDPLPPQVPAPSGVSQPGGAEPGGARPGGAESGGAEPGGAEPEGATSGAAEPGGAGPGGAEPAPAGPGGSPVLPSRREPLSPQELREWFARRWRRAAGAGASSPAEGAAAVPELLGLRVLLELEPLSLGVLSLELLSLEVLSLERLCLGVLSLELLSLGFLCCCVSPGALSPQELREWFCSPLEECCWSWSFVDRRGCWCCRSRSCWAYGSTGAGAAEGVSAETTAVCPGGGSAAGAAGGPAAGGVGGAGAVAEGAGAVPAESGAATRPRPYFVPLLQQVLGLSPSVECPQPVQSQSLLEPSSPLPAPSPYTGPTGGLAERREPASRPASPVRATRASGRGSRQRPPPVPGTHRMSLRLSTAPLRDPLPSPPESSLALADPESDSLRAASPTVTRLLATVVTDPSFESTAASALVAELVDFAARCRLDYAAGLVAESASVCPPSVGGECALGTDVLEDRQEELLCLAAASSSRVCMLAPEGDPDALDIPTPRSYAEAVEGPYSSQWQAAMDAEMASWKSTGTYVDAVPPPGANIVSGMWIFRRQGVDYFQTFSPTPKMTTLRVLLHIAAQRDYELHSLDFSTAFLQVYGLRQAPRGVARQQRTTLAALGFAPSTADPSLFLRTDTSLPPFYILVYVDDLVFATADTAGLAYVKSELLKRHTCTDLGELRSYLGLQITRDRARRTITLTQSHMVQQVLQRFGFTYSSPQATPLPTRHSLSALPSDESVESSGPYAELTRAHGCSEEGIALPVQYVGHGACAWRAESSGPYRPRGRFLG
ncbi:unnamed protein product [Closterium sp. NIES-65]|nr:unnamed protein product [Closterium sp. NIES-65]